ncbi:hypothetical protein LZL87_014291 [Fusarium oxysporum]|nr:hypothetical protein LZL87_014291 [Fusarium oxysporum]
MEDLKTRLQAIEILLETTASRRWDSTDLVAHSDAARKSPIALHYEQQFVTSTTQRGQRMTRQTLARSSPLSESGTAAGASSQTAVKCANSAQLIHSKSHPHAIESIAAPGLWLRALKGISQLFLSQSHLLDTATYNIMFRRQKAGIFQAYNRPKTSAILAVAVGWVIGVIASGIIYLIYDVYCSLSP